MTDKLNLYQYNQKTESEKAHILFTDGIFLESINYEENRNLLYSLFNFFVEVTYIADSNEISNLKTFKSTDLIEPYLNKIDLSKLI